MRLSNSDTWIIYCMGASIKGRIEELIDHFKDCENTIAVNSAVRDFPSTYWALLDSYPYDMNLHIKDRKIITSTANYERVTRNHPDMRIYEKCGETSSNSGHFACRYAYLKGAKTIITCGLDLDDDWKYYNDWDNSHQHINYSRFVRNEFRRWASINRNRVHIMSVNKNNILGLDYYDTKE